MRAVDIGDLHGAVAVQIGRADRGKPAVGAADVWRGCEQAEALPVRRMPVDGEARTKVAVALHHDDFDPSVAVEIGEAGGEVLEDLGLGQRHAAGDAIGEIVELGDEGSRLDRVAEDAMGVAGGGILEPGGDDAGGAATLRERALHRGTDPGRLFAGGGDPCPGQPHAQRRAGAAGEPAPRAERGPRRHRSQICFSGICTTSPSSASVTLS
jgi:hypothetical protein